MQSHEEPNKYKFSAKTDPGKDRDLNQDVFLAAPELDLWLVADGMGGHQSGDVASAITRKTISEGVGSGVSLVDAVRNAHSRILDEAAVREDAKNMGSTVVAVQVEDIDYQVAWVGDSRAYLYDGKLMQISTDHSYIQDLVGSGAISEEEARSHPSRHLLTRSLGASDSTDVDVSVRRGRFSQGQEILLCSDGLTDELSDDEIQQILALNQDPKDRVDRLVEAALDHGGHDNVTALLFSAPIGASYESSSMTKINMVVLGAALAVIALGIAYYIMQ